MSKKEKNWLFWKLWFIIVCVLLVIVISFNFISFKTNNITPNEAINNIFHGWNWMKVWQNIQSGSFFSSQKIQLWFSTMESMEDIAIQWGLSINSFFDKKSKDAVTLYFEMSDQVWDDSIVSWNFVRISDNQKKYFYINDFILTWSTWIQQFSLWQQILWKMLKKWFFLENNQDFWLLTKSFDLHKFILYTPKLSSFLPQHINIWSWEIQYNSLPLLDKYLPKVSQIIKDKFYNNTVEYKLSLKDKELLLLFFWLPPTLTMDDLLEFDAVLGIEGNDASIVFTWLSFYRFPYKCNWYLDSYKYTFQCMNKTIDENFELEIFFDDKDIIFEYSYPEIKLKMDWKYSFSSQDEQIVFGYNGLVSIQHDDLLYHKFVDMNVDLWVVLWNNIENIEAISWAISLFDVIE